jgi:hypothetical protein
LSDIADWLSVRDVTDAAVREAIANLRISQTLPLKKCAKAHEIIAAGQRSGSVRPQMLMGASSISVISVGHVSRLTRRMFM